MLEDTTRKEISDLGEFGLIAHLTENLPLNNKSSVLGVGDDAAVLGENKKKTLVSTDILVEGVHFDLSFHPLKHLGYKAAAVNISDICAMNATPTQIVVSLAFSNRFSLQAIDELYDGIKLATEAYGVDIVGGDISSSRSGLVISITAIGEANDSEIVYRKGAKNNDLLCVSGDLSGAYLGLQLLEREKQVFLANPDMQPDLEGHDYVLQRQLKPEARLDIVKELKKAGVKPTSMIDISDGLSSEVLHLSNASKVGFTLYETKIPIDPTAINLAEEFNLDPLTCALNGGEDYELLFTIPQADYEKIAAIDSISVIGHATEDIINKVITKNDNSFELKAQGWQHGAE
ncbi:MAG: thiamine-phosphate kinase [Bacteroidetes bacterium]|nr:MAG: thiamine-phosphate kinase [Bacteroidota bacterium]